MDPWSHGAPARTVSLAMEEALMAINPHLRFVTFDGHGFSVVELTPTEARLEWWAVEDRRDPAADAHRLAVRRVRADEARVLPA